MLADKYQQLLTAYVDGELSARQRRMVQKLLRKSPEARELLRRLQADSKSLINLSPPPVVPDLSVSVMQLISRQGIRPSRGTRRSPQTISIRTALAAAAGVLLMVGAASYVFFSSLTEEGRSSAVARRKKDPQGVKPENTDKPGKPVENGVIVKKPDPEKKPDKGNPIDVVKAPDKKPDPDKPMVPEKKPDTDDIVTAPSMEVFQPNSADVSVPTLLKLKELALELTRKTLVKELSRSEAFYVEVLCKEATHAFPRLQDAFKAGKIELVVDRTATERLKTPAIKATYGVYLEDITPDELAKLLQPLGVDDSKGDKKKLSVGQFLSNEVNLILCPMNAEHRRRLTNLLGVDPRQEKTLGPRGVDLKKPLSEQTADEVAEALAKEKPTSSVKNGERQAIAMAYLPTSTRTPSPEIKKVLDSRKPARPGTIQVLLVLRGRP